MEAVIHVFGEKWLPCLLTFRKVSIFTCRIDRQHCKQPQFLFPLWSRPHTSYTGVQFEKWAERR